MLNLYLIILAAALLLGLFLAVGIIAFRHDALEAQVVALKMAPAPVSKELQEQKNATEALNAEVATLGMEKFILEQKVKRLERFHPYRRFRRLQVQPVKPAEKKATQEVAPAVPDKGTVGNGGFIAKGREAAAAAGREVQ